jgi:hypothetical protein
MGKRELLLIVAFLVTGMVVYQVAAPARPESESRFSFSRMLEGLRRELRENSAEAEHTNETAIPVAAAVAELRVTDVRSVTIVGEERADIAASLQVHSTGVDEADALALAKRTAVKVDQTGSVVNVKVEYPVEGQQRAGLTLKIPKRLSVRLTDIRGTTELDGIQNLTLDEGRGELTVTNLPGELRGSFQGGRLRAESVGSARLTARRAEIEIDRIEREASLDLSGGSLNVTRVGGRLELTTNRVEVEIEEAAGEVRANLAEGRIELGGVRHEARIDGRRTEVTIQLEQPVPVTAFTNEEPLTVRLPAEGGMTIDATSTGGEILVPETLRDSLRVEKTTDEQRTRGAIRGGGPAISLRVTRGDVVLKQ